jgi:KinB signaling pathway activation protein
MTLKKWSYLFFTTFFIGGIGGLITGIVIGNTTFKNGFGDFIVGVSENILAGLMFSIIAQMGFFAYLTINYMAKSMIRSPFIWNTIQVILILVTLVDLVYLRYTMFGKGESILPYILLALIVLFISMAIAYVKVRATNRSAFIPTIFFMFVVTTIEWIPALRIDNIRSVVFMLVPLLLCNTWQIMQLHKLVGNEKGNQA